jgi:hypothetical protein
MATEPRQRTLAGVGLGRARTTRRPGQVLSDYPLR